MVPPRLSRVFLNEADTGTPEFKRWFKNSKVVDESGEPQVVFHATNSASDFTVFREFANIGHHFGTPQAAADRGKNRLGGKNVKTYEVYLSIQHPLNIDRDLLTWETGDIADLVWGKDSPQYDAIQTFSDHKRRSAELVKQLKKMGYDGIRYINAVEDPGSVSWIAFDATQVKSVQNKGTWDPRRGSIYE